MRSCIAIAVLALTACESTTDSGSGGRAKVAESGTAKGSAGGFSAQMSAELAKAGVGAPHIPPAAAGASTGAATTGSAASGAGAAASGGGSPATTAGAAASGGGSAASGAGAAASGGGSPATTAGAAGVGAAASGGGSPATAAGAAASGGGSPATAGAASSVGATTSGAASASGGAGAGGASSASAATAVGALKSTGNRAYVKPPADIAAIKFELEPNWERDLGEAGTFSLVVKVPNTEDTRVFSVRYGYEDQAAPVDCDSYKKFLEDRGAMKVTLNRQRGAACYLEGTDKGGALAYRFLLTYGGKRLMCHGSLYKDPASAALGDLRDKVLLQAKKICETLAL